MPTGIWSTSCVQHNGLFCTRVPCSDAMLLRHYSLEDIREETGYNSPVPQGVTISDDDDFSDVVTVSNLIVSKSQSVLLTVSDARLIKSKRGRTDVFVRVGDSTGSILVTFYNQQWILKDLKKGSKIMMSGKVVSLNGKISLQNPSFESVDKNSPNLHTGRLVPVYPLSLGLRQKTIRTMVFQGLVLASDQIKDFLPDVFLSRLGMMDLKTSVRKFHYPDSLKSFTNARRRLVFNELFFLQLSVQKRKIEWLKSVKSFLIS